MSPQITPIADTAQDLELSERILAPDGSRIANPRLDPFVADVAALERLGITGREHEILQLIAAGLSTREIAERLFVSENTVKTHASRVLEKLGARRRTQAVQAAKEAGILP